MEKRNESWEKAVEEVTQKIYSWFYSLFDSCDDRKLHFIRQLPIKIGEFLTDLDTVQLSEEQLTQEAIDEIINDKMKKHGIKIDGDEVIFVPVNTTASVSGVVLDEQSRIVTPTDIDTSFLIEYFKSPSVCMPLKPMETDNASDEKIYYYDTSYFEDYEQICQMSQSHEILDKLPVKYSLDYVIAAVLSARARGEHIIVEFNDVEFDSEQISSYEQAYNYYFKNRPDYQPKNFDEILSERKREVDISKLKLSLIEKVEKEFDESLVYDAKQIILRTDNPILLKIMYRVPNMIKIPILIRNKTKSKKM